ncbi:MAG: hypothetical protein K0S99_1173, partial [Thermomicrobiales bacterium]|nr:hypothetical protein [Thermomicrobiales bacterium]
LLTEAMQNRRIFELGENMLMHEGRSPHATTAIRLSVALESRPLALNNLLTRTCVLPYALR